MHTIYVNTIVSLVLSFLEFNISVSGSSCEYTFLQNTNGRNGVKQVNILSQTECQKRCDGNNLGSGLTCYAYDFNTVTNECYIFTQKNYVRNRQGSISRVNHYIKQENCLGSGNLEI